MNDNTSLRVAILDDYQQVALTMADWSRLPSHLQIEVFSQHMSTHSEILSSLQGFDVICIMRERTAFTRDIFDGLGKLKLLITSGAKNTSIDLQAACDHGVTVCGTHSPGHAASELAWALIMALYRQIVAEDKSIREGLWQTTLGRDLKGQTLGIIGLGRHGSNIAKFGNAFGMRLLAWSQNLDEVTCREQNVSLVDKETLLAEADVISIHLKMGQRYRGLIDAKALAMMKPTAYLVNTSRGPIINEADLINAIKKGQIAGAGLDVYDQEPLPQDHPLRSLPNTLLTSHVGFVTEQTYRVFYGEMVESILAWLDGKPVRVLN